MASLQQLATNASALRTISLHQAAALVRALQAMLAKTAASVQCPSQELHENLLAAAHALKLLARWARTQQSGHRSDTRRDASEGTVWQQAVHGALQALQHEPGPPELLTAAVMFLGTAAQGELQLWPRHMLSQAAARRKPDLCPSVGGQVSEFQYQDRAHHALQSCTSTQAALTGSCVHQLQAQ